jgi:hypothetical protein
MSRLLPLLAAASVAAATSAAWADPPPPDAQPLSRILQALEQQGDVAWFDEIEWDDDGYWEIEYLDQRGAKVEIKVDPVSGQPRS